jgi:hypothetical protein
MAKVDTMSNHFMERFVGSQGSNSFYIEDIVSIALGNLIYTKSLNKKNPYAINFCGNIDLAEYFYILIEESIFKRKTISPNLDMERFLWNYTSGEERNSKYKDFLANNKISIQNLKELQQLNAQQFNKLGEAYTVGYAIGDKNKIPVAEQASRQLIDCVRTATENAQQLYYPSNYQNGLENTGTKDILMVY